MGNIITVRVIFLSHSVRVRLNFQGLPWLYSDGRVEDLFY